MARSCRCTAPRQTNARLAHLINARPRLRSGRTKLAIVRSALHALERNVAWFMASGSLRWRHGTGCPRSSAPFEPFALRHHILKRNDVLRRMWPREEGDSTGCQGVGPVREMVMACGSSPRQRKDGVIWYRRNGGIHAAIKKQYQPRSKNSGIRHAPSMFGCADCLGKFRDAAHIRAYFISGCNRRRLVQGGRQTNEDSRS